MTLHHLLVFGALLLTFAAGSIPCCQKKSVGGVAYSLIEKDNPDTTSYGCLSNCVYQRDGFPEPRICFAPGPLEVECSDNQETTQPTNPDDSQTSISPSTTTTARTKIPETAKMVFFGSGRILNVPSFTSATECNVDSYPLSGLQFPSTAVIGDKVWNCGGYTDSDKVTHSECYQLTEGAWVQKANLTTPRRFCQASVTSRGEMLITGGFIGGGSDFTILASTEILSGGTWQGGPPLKEPVGNHCQVTIGNTVYITGGYTDEVTVTNHTYSWSTGDKTWTRLADTPTARYGTSCVVYGEDFLVLGGKNAQKRGLNTVERYNPRTNTWSVLTNLPVTMEWSQAGTVDDLVWIVHHDSSSFYTTTDLKKWSRIDVRGVNPAARKVFPAPLVTPDMVNC